MKNSKRLSLMVFTFLVVAVCAAVWPSPQNAVVSSSSQAYQAARLPIFRLAAPVVNEDTVKQQARATLGISGPINKSRSRLSIRSGTHGAVTNDNSEEGASVTDYTRDGDTIINSWFRTAREIQPYDNGYPAPDGPVVWVGVMYVGNDSADPFNDHIWEHGSLSADPRNPTFYVAMWTTC